MAGPAGSGRLRPALDVISGAWSSRCFGERNGRPTDRRGSRSVRSERRGRQAEASRDRSRLAVVVGGRLGSDGGRFVDRLDVDGRADRLAPRRVFVQARQIYCFAKAAQMGWYPDGRAVALKGLEYLLTRAKAPDGRPGFVHSLAPDGTVLDTRRDTYDHAFVLLALATVYSLDRDAQVRAEIDALLAYLDTTLRSPNGGFLEGSPASLPRRQNPQMHLFEAMIATFDATHEAVFQNRAGDFFALFLANLYDKQKHVLGEYFEDDWSKIEPVRRRTGTSGRMGLAAPGIRTDYRLPHGALPRRTAGVGVALSRRGDRVSGRRGRCRRKDQTSQQATVAAKRNCEGVDRAGRGGRGGGCRRGARRAGATGTALPVALRSGRLVRSIRQPRHVARRHDPCVVVLPCPLHGRRGGAGAWDRRLPTLTATVSDA